MCEKACPPRAISITYRFRHGFRKRPMMAPRASYYRIRMIAAAPYGPRRPMSTAVTTIPAEEERSLDLSAARRIIAETPKGPDRLTQMLYNLGQAYRRANELVIAEGYYRQALKIDPNFVAALFGYGFTRLAVADWAEAERANRAVTTAEPQNGPAWFNLGLALRGQGKQNDAAQAFQRARQIDPSLTPPPAPTATPGR